MIPVIDPACTACAIITARNVVGFSQASLAVLIGRSEPAISLYESAARTPDDATVSAICRVCGITLNDFSRLELAAAVEKARI